MTSRKKEDITVFLKTDNIILSKFSQFEYYSKTYLGWLNDKEVCKHNSHGVFTFTEKEAKTFYNSICDSEDLVLAIYFRKENEDAYMYVGNCCLQKINWVSQSAEFAILIGEKEYWGKGIAKEVLKLLLDHGFNKMNLNRIWSGTTETNIGMQKVFEKLNFKKEGVFRQAAFVEGKHVDIYEYAILKEEWK